MIAGEMGRSVWKHPDEYMKLVNKYRGTLARGKQGANVKVGIALHWNKVCGNCFDVPDSATAKQFNASYAQVRFCLASVKQPGRLPVSSLTCQQAAVLLPGCSVTQPSLILLLRFPQSAGLQQQPCSHPAAVQPALAAAAV